MAYRNTDDPVFDAYVYNNGLYGVPYISDIYPQVAEAQDARRRAYPSSQFYTDNWQVTPNSLTFSQMVDRGGNAVGNFFNAMQNFTRNWGYSGSPNAVGDIYVKDYYKDLAKK